MSVKQALGLVEVKGLSTAIEVADTCLLYTSDAADEEDV